MCEAEIKAPVALFVYKRKDKTEQCILALEKNRFVEQTDLIIFCDGSKGIQDKKDVADVRQYIHHYKQNSKFKSVYVFENAVNKGLANSIIDGVTMVMDKYGKAIVVEDDLITSEDFLEYMNDGLDFYEEDLRFGSISAYTYPLKELQRYKEDIYVLRKGDCWGWATWKNRWEEVDWEVKNFEELYADKKFRKEFCMLQRKIDQMLLDWKNGKVDSWAVRWCLHLFLRGQLTVYPAVSRARNIGVDSTGTNCGNNLVYNVSNIGVEKRCQFKKLGVNKRLEKAVAKFPSGWLKVKSILSKVRKK